MNTAADSTSRAARTPLSFESTKVADGVLLAIRGSCTMDVAGDLADRVLAAAAQSPPVLYLDLAGLDFIESTGLGGIVGGYLRVRKYQGEVRLISPQPEIKKLLDLTRLTQLFSVHASLAEAQKPGRH